MFQMDVSPTHDQMHDRTQYFVHEVGYMFEIVWKGCVNAINGVGVVLLYEEDV